VKLSDNGLNFIKKNEGFSARQYTDVAGHLTIGYGHLILPIENFTGVTLTDQQATDILLGDASHVEIFLDHICPGLYQNEFDALVDFGFNLGTGPLKMLLSHGLDEIPTQILRWDHAAGKVVQGLLDRRQRELDLWNLDDDLRMHG